MEKQPLQSNYPPTTSILCCFNSATNTSCSRTAPSYLGDTHCPRRRLAQDPPPREQEGCHPTVEEGPEDSDAALFTQRA